MHFGGDLLQDGILFLPFLSRLGRKYRVLSLSPTQKLWLLGPRAHSGPALGVVFLSLDLAGWAGAGVRTS